MYLDSEDVRNLSAGALFNACAAEPEWTEDGMRRVLAHMDMTGLRPELKQVTDLDPDALVVCVGFVNNGLSLSELRPVGDEFIAAIELIAEAHGREVAGLIPLAAGSANAVVPFLAGMQCGIPVIDADPMGRIFPLVSQTVFALNSLPIGPIAAVSALGESALLRVDEPARGERLLRALAEEFGGWAATASYPMTADALGSAGILGSLSNLIAIGRVLESSRGTDHKHSELRRSCGVRQIVRARVSEDSWVARPWAPSRVGIPASVVLEEEAGGQIIQLEVQSEILMMLSDGAVRAVSPDIITLLRPADCSVASLDDLWTGNVLDICVLRAASAWYTPAGRKLGRRPSLAMMEETR
ncbi:DUF917 domain-containing protein [Brevibacterium sp.]|uniref:DUF917 domain-containing protein n=1 Tax=Brevibacterium sp. TaxID=1701 RepID=UPI002811BDE4|nr:DUF917 domain-containing protein [Brevibacterium sp.]